MLGRSQVFLLIATVTLTQLVPVLATVEGQANGVRRVIAGEPTCKPCRVNLEHVARLGDDPEGYIVGWPLVVSKDSKDRWFVFEPRSPSEPKVYSYEGSFLRGFGVSGEGPGEFKAVVGLLEHPQDTLNFIDLGNGRISRFTSDLEYVDQLKLSIRPLYLLFTTDGRLVFNAEAYGSSSQGLPLHFMGPDGRPESSFGIQEPPFTRESSSPPLRKIAASMDGGVWSATVNRYELRHWNSIGELTHTIIRDTDWFQPHRDPGFRAHRREPPPNPRLQALQEDTAGLLWTAVFVPQSDWESGFLPDTTPSGRIWERPLDEEIYDTRIEVIDPNGGETLAATTIPKALGGFLGTGHGGVFFFTGHYSRVGEPFVDIWLARIETDSHTPKGR